MANQFDVDLALAFSGFFLLMGALALISLLTPARKTDRGIEP